LFDVQVLDISTKASAKQKESNDELQKLNENLEEISKNAANSEKVLQE
jgi:hypothetical protein